MNVLDKYFGFNPPFIGGPQNILSKQIGEKLIKNDILQYLRTPRGSRIHRPNYGTSIYRLVFDDINDENLINIKSEIITGLATEEPRITVTDVVIKTDSPKHIVYISVVGFLKDDPFTSFNLEASVGT